MFVNFDFWSLHRFNAFARSGTDWAIFNTSTTIDLNDNAWNQLLHTFHFSWTIFFLFQLSTLTTAPFSKFPKCWARLTVTLHQSFIYDRFFQLSTFLGWISSCWFSTACTTNYRLLCSTSARFAARRETWRWKREHLLRPAKKWAHFPQTRVSNSQGFFHSRKTQKHLK